jgi:hypothetical protein
MLAGLGSQSIRMFLARCRGWGVSKINIDGACKIRRRQMKQRLAVGWKANLLGSEKALGGPADPKLTDAHVVTPLCCSENTKQPMAFRELLKKGVASDRKAA